MAAQVGFDALKIAQLGWCDPLAAQLGLGALKFTRLGIAKVGFGALES